MGDEQQVGSTAEEFENVPFSVKVHPIVVFSILDHYIRRQEGQERVIGTLLGVVHEDSGIVEVTNSYAVPHTETGGEVAVGQAFNKSMFGLLSRVNSTEQIVGWYATNGADGKAVNDSSSLIHDFYARECERAVHVVVDAALADGKGVDLKAYYGLRLAVGGEELAHAFCKLKCELEFSEGEKVCIDRMIRGQEVPFETAESLAALPSDVETVKSDMDDLLQSIDEILTYVDAVNKGEKQPDPKVARCIADALAVLPNIDKAMVEGQLNAETQDIVMVSYLASITKAQLAIAAKIHESF